MSKETNRIWIGTSGYQYDHWRESFYPADLPKKNWFTYYGRHFSTVEINNTFYHLPKPETFSSWREDAPAGFQYALKFSRYATHMKKLKEPEQSVGNFLAAADGLEEKFGPILLQLPPNWRANPERLDRFLHHFPRGRRLAVEFRDSSWLDEPIFSILEKHQAALCVHDLIADHPDPVCTTWAYYRFHGRDYGGSYSPQKLSAVADRLVAHYREGRDVYVYFNNDRDGYAPDNALALRRYLRNRL